MNEHSPLDAADDAAMAPPSRGTRLLAVGVLLVVALAGVVGGIALERTVFHGRPDYGRGAPGRGGERRPGSRRPSDMLGADLKLSPDQAVRIDTLIERQMRGFREIRHSTQPAIDSLMAQTRRAMDSIFTPAQRATLDSARAKREADFRKRFPNGAPPRGTPGDRGRGPDPRP